MECHIFSCMMLLVHKVNCPATFAQIQTHAFLDNVYCVSL